MYNINLSSSGSRFRLSTEGGVSVITDNDGNKKMNSEDFYKDIQSKYPDFEAQVKENLIKYGRTLRSLKPNEVVIINVGLSANKLANLPNTIQFMVSKSDIDAFTKGSKSLNQVMDAINLRKLKAGLNNSSAYAPMADGQISITQDAIRAVGNQVQAIRDASENLSKAVISTRGN